MHFTFIELPKFKPQSMLEKRMAVLWLRFLTEINASTDQVPEELTENPEINKALAELKVTAFTDAELRAYDKALDNIRVERTLLNDRYKKGMEKGIQKGIGQGILQGIEKVAKAMLLNRVPDNQIIAYTSLTQEQLNSLKD